MSLMRVAITRRFPIILMTLSSGIFLGSLIQSGQVTAYAKITPAYTYPWVFQPLEDQISPAEYQIYAALIDHVMTGDDHFVLVKDMTNTLPEPDTKSRPKIVDRESGIVDWSLPKPGEDRGVDIRRSIWSDMYWNSAKSYKLDYAPQVGVASIVLRPSDDFPGSRVRWFGQDSGGSASSHSTARTHALAFSRAGFDAERRVALVQWTDQCGSQRCLPVTSILTCNGGMWAYVMDDDGTRTQAPQLDMAQLPSTDKFYPPISKRVGDKGVVMTQLLVGADGRVLSVVIERSSGFPRLDSAAIEFAKALRFLPLSKDQAPLATYYIHFPGAYLNASDH